MELAWYERRDPAAQAEHMLIEELKQRGLILVQRDEGSSTRGTSPLLLACGGQVKLAFALIADYATAGSDGKLNIVGGGIDRLHVRGDLPARFASLAIIFRIDFTNEDVGRAFPLSIRLTAPDGEKMGEDITFNVRVGEAAHPAIRPSPANLVLIVQGLEIQRLGPHTWTLLHDGDPLGSVVAEAVAAPAVPEVTDT